MKSAGEAAGCALWRTFYVFELRSNWTENRQLAADSQQMKKCKKRKSERHQTEQLSHQDKVYTPHPGEHCPVALQRCSLFVIFHCCTHNPGMTFLFPSLFHKMASEAVYGRLKEIVACSTACGCELSRHILCAICQTLVPLEAFRKRPC